MGTKISELTALTPIADADLIPCVDDSASTTKKITFANFLASFITNGEWTPALTFATPGDLTVAYSIRVGSYNKTGNLYTLWFSILTSTFTHTTAGGLFRITGIPAAAVAASGTLYYTGSIAISSFSKANYTQFIPVILAGTSNIEVIAIGQGQSESNIGTGELTTGSTVLIRGSISYRSA
jgi:hypothetical protein